MPPRLNITIKETRRKTSAKEVGINFCYECVVLKDETCLNILEHVMVEVRLKTWSIPLRIVLISPSGTKSVLVNYTSTQKKETNSAVWFTSVHFWNESAFGIWRLVYTEIQPPVDGNDFQPLLTLYGTRQRTSNQTNRSNNICDKRKRDTGKTTSFIHVTFGTDTSIKKTSTAESSATSIFTDAVKWFKNSPANIVFPVLLGIFAPLLCVLIQKKTKFCITSRRLPAGEQNSSKVCLMGGSEFIQTIE
ncbi:uncharacterized protein LOC128553489 [Mercenaria mercenaria]|uniref:uncharacterized protein LOC128553489 n=1 Tax=Mercenaria mercenaria TaxID=6596 RepID=UPI00234E45DA|nr:uncharacterized protein LOC128553489 [Mercenaria mercenaria]